MASQRTEGEHLVERVSALEEELARQRHALAALAKMIGESGLDALIEELADRPVSEEEMEAAFARLDATLDAAR